jgi:hypothetical protein
MRWVAIRLSLTVYCIAIFLSFDFAFSRINKNDDERKVRIPNAAYDHTLAPNFDGYSIWGEVRYRIFTNSLGFKDAGVRDVPLHPTSRRVILIGDSFTEAVGISFEKSFAGLLYQVGQAHSPKIEYLNAGLGSYSPAVYYRKIKQLLESGLQFDEVIVFSDISDVYDEATRYFCIDDDPVYQSYCPVLSNSQPATSVKGEPKGSEIPKPRLSFAKTLETSFPLSNKLRLIIKLKIRELLSRQRKRELLKLSSRGEWGVRVGWAVPGYNAGNDYAPLGVEGGITRSLKNMQALADLLKSRNIPLSIVVYPWPLLIEREDYDNRQVRIWRDFCLGKCKAFIDLFPAFIAKKKAHDDWYERLFIPGDVHFSVGANELVFGELAKHFHLSGDGTNVY